MPLDHEQSPTGLSTGPPSGRRVPVKEAARILGTTVEGVRARIKRGTLAKEKDADGTVYVLLEGIPSDQPHPDADRTTDWAGDRTGLDPDQTLDDLLLVETLREEVALLRTELEDWKEVVSTRDRELEARTEELKRRDLVVAQMNATISELARRLPELGAPSEPSEAPETPGEGAGGSPIPPDEDHRSWWRRFFGLGP
jgi:hypothetical protein